MSLPQIAGLELQELIGRGSCGAVYRAVANGSKESCAVKVFSSMSINRKMLTIALRGLQSMPEHPGILRALQFDFDNSPYFCAMPLVGFMTEDGRNRKVWDTPTLESCCGSVPPDEAWRYIYEICDAMAWLHKHNLVHCNLKPRNVLMENDQSSATKITDPVQGWIHGVHHFDATDHFMYMPPEQAEHPDQLPVVGTQWDVYSFGVLAYRLLTGRFPRAAEIYDAEMAHQQNNHGMPRVIDSASILAAVHAQQQITWPNKPASKWDERRKQIIERCLNLDLKKRWPDLREVMREFERLEADFLLEDAREKIEIEKKRQVRKVFLLRASALVLGTAFVVATIYGISYGLLTLNRAKKAETTIVENAAAHLNEVTARESTISTLSTQMEEALEAKRVADANLQMSQEAVDNLLTQILEIPAGLGLGTELSDKPINDALSFYRSERETLKYNDDLLPERARNYFNSAQLLMRQQKREDARSFFVQAKDVLEKLIQKEPTHTDLPRRQALLGRTNRWLGTLKSDDGHRAEAGTLFKQAVAAFEPALKGDETNRSTRDEMAVAYYELGRRLRRDGNTQEAVDALQKVTGLLDVNLLLPDKKLNNVEQFLLARSQIEQALALRDSGREDDAMKALFDAMEVMVKLVERAAPNNKEQALTLAEAYVEFGSLISGKLGSTDAKDAQAEAQAILMELLRVDPQWAEARYLLARSHGDLASIERDGGNGSEAVRKQALAVKTLTELSQDNPDNTRFLSELARQLGQQAQLLCDLGKGKDAIPLAEQAVTQVETLLAKQGELDELDRKSCGVLLAQLYGILGQSGELARNATLAKSSFTKASAQWEALQAQHGADQTISQGLDWSKSKLKAIK